MWEVVAGGLVAAPKLNEAPPPLVVVVAAGLAPNEKEGVRDGVRAAVVATAEPLLPNAGVAAMLTAGLALNVKAGVESGTEDVVAGTFAPKVKGEEAAVVVEVVSAVATLGAGAALWPKVNIPGAGPLLAVVAAVLPKAKGATWATAVETVAATEACAGAAGLEEPKEKTAVEAAAALVTEAAEAVAPNVKLGTGRAAVLAGTLVVVAGAVTPNVKLDGAGAVVVAEAGAVVVLLPKLNTAGVVDALPSTFGASLAAVPLLSVPSDLLAGVGVVELWSPVRLKVTVAGLVPLLSLGSAALVGEEILPREKAVAVVEVDEVIAADGVGLCSAGFSPSGKAKPPLLAS